MIIYCGIFQLKEMVVFAPHNRRPLAKWVRRDGCYRREAVIRNRIISRQTFTFERGQFSQIDEHKSQPSDERKKKQLEGLSVGVEESFVMENVLFLSPRFGYAAASINIKINYSCDALKRMESVFFVSLRPLQIMFRVLSVLG